MICAPCWLNVKQRNSNYEFRVVLIFIAIFLAREKVDASLCKQGWVEWNNMCYKLNHNLQKWNIAQSDCVAEGANLVSIGSEEEHIFVLSLLHNASINDIWIGLNDNDNEGQLQWTDQSPLVFTNMSNTTSNTPDVNCVRLKANDNEWEPQYCVLGSESLCKYVPNILISKEDLLFQANYTRQQLYITMPDKLLLNHVFSKKSSPSLLHCTSACLRDPKCMSFNYRSPQSQIKNGLCLLNNATAEEFPEDFVDNCAYIYALPIK